jgi:hypothetical protein
MEDLPVGLFTKLKAQTGLFWMIGMVKLGMEQPHLPSMMLVTQTTEFGRLFPRKAPPYAGLEVLTKQFMMIGVVIKNTLEKGQLP